MLTRWQGIAGAVVVTLGTVALVILNVTEPGFRLWWLAHALTTDTVSGMLVVLLTVLVVDQVVRRRQILDRVTVISAQAAAVGAQAGRSVQAVNAALASSGHRDAADDACLAYKVMLLVAAPVLIDARVSRNFLEEAQRLAGEMAHALAVPDRASAESPPSTERLDASLKRLQAASAPLRAQPDSHRARRTVA